MSDKNTAPTASEPTKKETFLQSAFWTSWWGKGLFLIALAFFTDSDKLLDDVGGPALAAAGRVARRVQDEALALWLRISGLAKNLVWKLLAILIGCTAAAAIGSIYHSRWLVAVAILVAVGSITFLVAKAFIAFNFIKVAFEGGKLVAGTVLGGMLQKVGFASIKGDVLDLKLGDGEKFLKSILVIPAAALALGVPLVSLPYFTVFIATVILSIPLLSTVFSAYIAGVDSKKSWERIHAWSVKIVIVGGIGTVLSLFLPKVWESLPSRLMAFDAWLASPTFDFSVKSIVLALVFLAVVLGLIAAFFHDKKRVASSCKFGAWIALVAIPASVIFMAATGTWNWTQVQDMKEQFVQGPSAPAASPQANWAQTEAPTGSSTSMDAPEGVTAKVASKPRRAPVAKAPEPDPTDIAGVVDLLDRIASE